jgi:colanic acid/amylovoran biosynthesis glycosyltransferase
MGNLKIAFIVNRFPAISETFIINQIVYLLDQGHDVKILSFGSKPPTVVHQIVEKYGLIGRTTYFEKVRHSAVARAARTISRSLLHVVPILKEIGWRALNPNVFRASTRHQALLQKLESFLGDSRYDIVHAHFGPRATAVASLIRSGRVSGFKFVATFHGFDMNPKYLDRYRTEYVDLFKYADAVTVNSPYLRDVTLSVYPNPRLLVVLPAALDTQRYARKGKTYEADIDFAIIFCGRLIALKGPDLAIQIMHELVNNRGIRSVKLRIIGDGPLRVQIQSLISKLNLTDHVSVLGSMSQEEVILEMERGQMFLLPGVPDPETGRVEAQGLVVQEAQAMELPVIVSDAGGIKYGLNDGVTGFVVPYGDIPAFADKIEALVKDRPRAMEMGKSGRQFVVSQYDISILGQKLVELYLKL